MGRDESVALSHNFGMTPIAKDLNIYALSEFTIRAHSLVCLCPAVCTGKQTYMPYKEAHAV